MTMTLACIRCNRKPTLRRFPRDYTRKIREQRYECAPCCRWPYLRSTNRSDAVIAWNALNTPDSLRVGESELFRIAAKLKDTQSPYRRVQLLLSLRKTLWPLEDINQLTFMNPPQKEDTHAKAS